MKKLIVLLFMAGMNGHISGKLKCSLDVDVGSTGINCLETGFTFKALTTLDEFYSSLPDLKKATHAKHTYPYTAKETSNIAMQANILLGLMTPSVENNPEDKSLHLGHTHNMPDWNLLSDDVYLKTYTNSRKHRHQAVIKTNISLLLLPIFKDNLTIG